MLPSHVVHRMSTKGWVICPHVLHHVRREVECSALTYCTACEEGVLVYKPSLVVLTFLLHFLITITITYCYSTTSPRRLTIHKHSPRFSTLHALRHHPQDAEIARQDFPEACSYPNMGYTNTGAVGLNRSFKLSTLCDSRGGDLCF